jgi:predicted nucleic acid-binding protein
MKIDVFQRVYKIFLDTAPVIYYIEATPAYADIVQAAFALIDAGQTQALVSPVTLAKCLTLPIRQNQSTVVQLFTDLLTNTEGISMVEINAAIGQKSAELRVQYKLKLPDALQIATAIHYGCDTFLTNDIDLKRVKELRIIALEDLK